MADWRKDVWDEDENEDGGGGVRKPPSWADVLVTSAGEEVEGGGGEWC